MLHHLKKVAARKWPIIITGLFAGRIASEIWSTAFVPAEVWQTVAVAVILGAAALAGSNALLRTRVTGRLWPLLFLLLYLADPSSDYSAAIISGALAMTAWVIQRLVNTELSPTHTRGAFLSAVVMGGFFLAVYAATAAPGVLPADSGEMQLVAADLGVAHPPGFPLFTLLGHAATRLPIPTSPALKLNLLSAATSALSLVLLFLTTFRMTRSLAASITAALALGSSATFWATATTANVRSLTGLFAALAFYALVNFASGSERHRASESAVPRLTKGTHDRHLLVFAAAVGFGITHHASLVFISAVFFVFLGITEPSLLLTPRRWRAPALAGLAGLIPLAYLPWRGWASNTGASVTGATGALTTVNGFLDHVLARGFQGDFFYFSDPAVLWQRFRVIGNVMTFQFPPMLLLGMILGFLLLVWRDRRAAFLLGGSFAIHAFITATYRAPQTVEYMLPAYFPAVICLGYAASNLMDLSRKRFSQLGIALVSFLFLSAAIQMVENFQSFSYLRRDSSTVDYTERIFRDAPANSAVLADWHWVTPLNYKQRVEGIRPDLRIDFVYPTSEPYGDTWARRIGEELARGFSVVSTHFDDGSYAGLPVPEPLGDAFLFRQEPIWSLPSDFQPVAVELGGKIAIRGYKLEAAQVEVGRQAVLTVAWQPSIPAAAGARTFPGSRHSLFAHLVGFDGQIYAQEDPQAVFQPDGLTLTRFNLTPRIGAMPGDFAIMLGAYSEEPLLNKQGQARNQIATLAVLPMSQPLATSHRTYMLDTDSEPRRWLVGYDWDNTVKGHSRLFLHWKSEKGYVSEVIDNPGLEFTALAEYYGPWGIRLSDWSPAPEASSSYVPFGEGIIWLGPLLDETDLLLAGAKVLMEQKFIASHPVTRDLATSVRLIGYEDDGYHWAWSDLDEEFGVPAMGGIPTLKWVAGSTILDTHALEVDEKALPGQQVGATLGLYDTFTNRPLPVLDERMGSGVPWKTSVIAPDQ